MDFLGRYDDDQWDEDAAEVFESVLGLCKGAAALAALSARWRYRSRQESLIRFSNRQFYNSSLVAYPGALEAASDVGVELLHVPDGIYGRGSSKYKVLEAPCDPELPATVYLMNYPEFQCLKIGVTAAGRIEEHEPHGWCLVESWRFQLGYDALEIEELLLDR